MPQDAFHIRRLAKELNELLVGGKINRISQVNKDELTFIVYTGKSTVKLIVSANASGARACVSATEKEPAPVAPNFCMLLRKYLQGAEILEIRQHAFERIIEMDFHCTTDFSESNRTLVCELMGKYSNVLLTENGVILGALKTSALEDNTHRILLSGAKYRYPAPQDKLSHLDGAGMRSRLENHLLNRPDGMDLEELSVWIFENVAGLALPTARQLVKRAFEKAGSVRAILSPSSAAPVWAFVGAFCEQEANEPCLLEKDGQPVDFFAFKVEGGIPMPSLCKAEDEYFTRREGKKAFEDKKRKLENTLRALRKKQAKKWQETAERLKDAEKADEERIKGELLTANLYRLEKGMQRVELENWYDERGGSITVPLDATLTPAQNAQRYFKTYNKYKRAREILTPMLKKEEEEIAYTDSILSSVLSAEATDDLTEITEEMTALGLLRAIPQRVGGKKKETTVPFRVFTHNGLTILVGRNNLQNDRLLKEAAPDDIWLHAQKYHSSHVIIQTQGGQVCDETLLFAAELCAYYSSGRESDKLPIDYCKRKFVKKPSKSKAGFVVYTDYKTVLVKPKKSAAESV